MWEKSPVPVIDEGEDFSCVELAVRVASLSFPYSGWAFSCTLNGYGAKFSPVKLFKSDAYKPKFSPSLGIYKKFPKQLKFF